MRIPIPLARNRYLRSLTSTYNKIFKQSVVSDWDINRSTIRVRRSSDDAEQDFPPLHNQLDVIAIGAFVGAGSGYVTTIYDRYNSNHATQTTAGNQPRLINAGTFEVNSNGMYSLYYDGVDNFMNITDNVGLDILSGGLSILAEFDTEAQAGYIFSRNLDSIATQQYGLLSNATGTVDFYLEGAIRSTDPTTDLNNKIIIATYNSTQTNVYLNGGIKDTDSVSTSLTSRPNIQIGCRSNSVDGLTKTVFFKGHITKISIFKKGLTLNEVALLTNKI